MNDFGIFGEKAGAASELSDWLTIVVRFCGLTLTSRGDEEGHLQEHATPQWRGNQVGQIPQHAIQSTEAETNRADATDAVAASFNY